MQSKQYRGGAGNSSEGQFKGERIYIIMYLPDGINKYPRALTYITCTCTSDCYYIPKYYSYFPWSPQDCSKCVVIEKRVDEKIKLKLKL